MTGWVSKVEKGRPGLKKYALWQWFGRSLLLAVLALALLTAGRHGYSASTPATLKVEPAGSRVCLPEQTLEYRVEVANVTNLAGYDLYLTFDPTVVQLSNVRNGEFLAPGISPRVVTLDNNAGNLNAVHYLIGGTPVSGSGVLLRFSVECIAGVNEEAYTYLTLVERPGLPLLSGPGGMEDPIAWTINPPPSILVKLQLFFPLMLDEW